MAILSGHTKQVGTAGFSPDSKRVLSASYDKTARIWNALTGEEVAHLGGDGDTMATARFNPEGTRVVTASFDGTARVWDAATGKELLVLNGHSPEYVYSATFSPDGKQILTAGGDGTARIWDAATGKQMLALNGHSGRVYGAVFSRDGKHILTASEDKTARVWDASTGSQLTILSHHDGIVEDAFFSPDESQILTFNLPSIHIWDAGKGTELFALETQIFGWTDGSIAYSPDGKQILTSSGGGGALISDARTGKQLREDLDCAQAVGADYSRCQFVEAAGYSPDGKRVATGNFQSGTVVVRDAATWQPLLVLGTDAAEARQVEAAQNERRARAALTATPTPGEAVTTPLATAAAQGAQAPPQTSPNGRVVLSDSFDQNGYGWETSSYYGDTFKTSESIADGKYQWDVEANHSPALDWELPKMPDVSEFTASVDARQISGTPNGRYGLIFRWMAGQRFYLFDIADDQSFKVSFAIREDPGENLLSGKSPAINPGQVNRLTVVGKGGHFTFFVNGEHVAEAQDATLANGTVGVAVELPNEGNQVVVEFDNFEVRAP